MEGYEHSFPLSHPEDCTAFVQILNVISLPQSSLDSFGYHCGIQAVAFLGVWPRLKNFGTLNMEVSGKILKCALS